MNTRNDMCKKTAGPLARACLLLLLSAAAFASAALVAGRAGGGALKNSVAGVLSTDDRLLAAPGALAG